jgi:hypothetical protein
MPCLLQGPSLFCSTSSHMLSNCWITSWQHFTNEHTWVIPLQFPLELLRHALTLYAKFRNDHQYNGPICKVRRNKDATRPQQLYLLKRWLALWRSRCHVISRGSAGAWQREFREGQTDGSYSCWCSRPAIWEHAVPESTCTNISPAFISHWLNILKVLVCTVFSVQLIWLAQICLRGRTVQFCFSWNSFSWRAAGD